MRMGAKISDETLGLVHAFGIGQVNSTVISMLTSVGFPAVYSGKDITLSYRLYGILVSVILFSHRQTGDNCYQSITNSVSMQGYIQHVQRKVLWAIKQPQATLRIFLSPQPTLRDLPLHHYLQFQAAPHTFASRQRALPMLGCSHPGVSEPAIHRSS